MATPMTPTETVLALKKWHVPFKEVDGWRHRNRDTATGKTFGPVHGFVVHHTGDDAPDLVDLHVIIRGRSDLPGPLAQFGCGDDGTIWLIGCGRANHAGGGDPVVLNAVIRESYVDYPPKTTKHEGSAGAADGNDCFYGVETFYSGTHPPTKDAYTSLVLLAAAICDHHGWTAKSVIGHKEWSNYKVDPGHVDMKTFRADVQAALDAGHDGRQGSQPGKAAEAVVNVRRAQRRLVQTLDASALALKNLDVAVDNGWKVRRIRYQVRKARNNLRRQNALLRGKL